MLVSPRCKLILLPSGCYRNLLPALMASVFAAGCASSAAPRQEATTAEPAMAESQVAEAASANTNSGAMKPAATDSAPAARDVAPEAEPAPQPPASESPEAEVTASTLAPSVDIDAIREGSSPVSPPENAGSGAAHLVFVARLIEESSAAQQIDDSDNPAAHLRRNEAREYYRSAVTASAAGDTAQADQLGKKAAQMMFKAVRLAESDEVIEAKHERDYRRRLESVNALLDAHQRVGAEDELGTEFSQTREVIRQRVGKAEALHQDGQLEQAREQLDAAYVTLKLSIQSARDGETRIRSLDFATKEEEYRHELARNDTHQKLVRLFMQDSKTSKGLKRMVENFLDKGKEAREQAEEQASDGEYEAAVKSMNDSTGQLIRALRTVGIFIPG